MTISRHIRIICRHVVLLLGAVGVTWTMVSVTPADLKEGCPSTMSLLRQARPQTFCGEGVPMDNPEVKERFEREFLLSVWNDPQAILWMKRSKRYFSVIEPMLKSSGLPDDLKYVAVAESALRPHAGSSKGAMGFWQFMPATARRYGLTIDHDKDERRSIFRSTQAAISYFKRLREQFGSWTLAAAAYNMGEHGLTTEIREQQTDNYYDLYLPLETQGFLFRILAIKLIMTHPDQFGFDLTPADYYPPLAVDRVCIDCAGETPLRLVAQAARTSFKIIKDLNPDIRGYSLTQGTHHILVPKGASAGFQNRLSELVRQPVSGQESRTYIVQKGDTLLSIATKFKVSLPSILLWNRLDPNQPIHPGDRLTIHSGK